MCENGNGNGNSICQNLEVISSAGSVQCWTVLNFSSEVNRNSLSFDSVSSIDSNRFATYANKLEDRYGL